MDLSGLSEKFEMYIVIVGTYRRPPLAVNPLRRGVQVDSTGGLTTRESVSLRK